MMKLQQEHKEIHQTSPSSPFFETKQSPSDSKTPVFLNALVLMIKSLQGNP